MPVLSISLSDEAYQILIEQAKGDRSRIVSAAILQWNALKGVKWEVLSNE